MASVTPVPEWQLSEDDVAAAGPRVRALVVSRLEALYELVQAQIHLAEENGRPVDPRWAELGIRILKEHAAVYRLHKPAPVAEEDGAVPVPVEEIEAQLRELEAKLLG